MLPPAPKTEACSQDRQPDFQASASYLSSGSSSGDEGGPQGGLSEKESQQEPPTPTNEKESPAPEVSTGPSKESLEPSPTASPTKPAHAQQSQPPPMNPSTQAAHAALATTEGAIPSLDDEESERPPHNEPSLTPGAIDRRLRRVVTPKADGTFKVDKRFVEEFHKKGTARKSLEKIFASCGYNPDSL